MGLVLLARPPPLRGENANTFQTFAFSSKFRQLVRRIQSQPQPGGRQLCSMRGFGRYYVVGFHENEGGQRAMDELKVAFGEVVSFGEAWGPPVGAAELLEATAHEPDHECLGL